MEHDDEFYRLHGRVNALELLAKLAVLNLAQIQPNPFEWVQSYVEAMRTMIPRGVSLVDNPTESERTRTETRTALEEFLEELLMNMGKLKGAPDKPPK